jgi:di/tricarboxylate transporter
MDIWIVSSILALTIIFLVTEKLPLGMISLGIIASLSLTQILTPTEAVSGFANPAVITVAAMFLISQGLIRTGAVELLTENMLRLSKGNATYAMALVFLIVMLSSAFINNTPVVVLFIPVVMSMCCEFGLSPSKYLMPLSYTSILAGTCTLIGTSTNIIVSDLSAGNGYGSIGMFELAKVGIPIAILGIIFMVFTAPRLLPAFANPVCELENSRHRKFLSQFLIPKESSLVGQNPCDVFKDSYPSIEVVELVRYDLIYYPKRDHVRIAGDDLLLVKGSAKDLLAVMEAHQVELPQSKKDKRLSNEVLKQIIVEVIIPPQSRMLGVKFKDIPFFHNSEFHVIAVQRSGLHYTERQIRDIQLKVGDILLVQLPWEKLDQLRQRDNLIVVEDIHHSITYKTKASHSGLIFLGVVLTASTGLLDIMVSAITGVFLMLLTGCLQVRDAYRALQADVLMLIAGAIGLGYALESTGASRLYADFFLTLLEGASPQIILGMIIFLTSISTQLLSNNATAVLLLPIAISTAVGLGVSPKPFIIGVCFGASACFASPLGYQTNLLVYGPGGYRFTDYMILGVPLNLIVLLLGTWLIPIFWPL